MPRVVFHGDFERDVRKQIAYLRAQGDEARVFGLLEDLAELKELLASFPEAGRELTRQGTESLRKLKARRSPFFVWYSFEPDLDEVTFFRLFHGRQRTREPRLR